MLSFKMLFAVLGPLSVSSLPSLPPVENPVTPLDLSLPHSVSASDGGWFC